RRRHPGVVRGAGRAGGDRGCRRRRGGLGRPVPAPRLRRLPGRGGDALLPQPLGPLRDPAAAGAGPPGGRGRPRGPGRAFRLRPVATLMATPCSAPFLGTAIGFGLAQPAPVVFAIFLAAGTGLALPYLVLAAAPGAARFLPRPGAWMETLRGIMGFLLAASAVWLLYVLAAQVSPERLALFEVGLLLVALVTWLHHRAAAGGRVEASATGGGARADGGALASLVALVVLVVVVAGGGR